MKDVYAHPIVVSALDRLAQIEKWAYAVESQGLTARAKLARIRLLRSEARIVVKKLKRQLRSKS
jgi:hypothetical protein